MLELHVRSAGRVGAWFRVDAPDHVFALAPTITHAQAIAAIPELIHSLEDLLHEEIGCPGPPYEAARQLLKRLGRKDIE
jgi:hypothetical protein